jgi:antitoxin component YwqK of YwqJK toxin-antitoxin module
MNRLFTVIIFFVLFSCNNGQNIKVVDKWENGKNKTIITYDNPNDTLTYLREFYFKNGQIGTKGKFVNGKQDGLWEWWYDNGNKKDEAKISNGAYKGERKHWREDGTLKQIEIISGQCSGDCCDGKVIYYTEKGEKLIEYTQQNGQWNGEGIGYYPDGKLKRKFRYVEGKKQGMNYEYLPNGVIEAEGNYVDDLEDGKWTYRDSTGKVTGYQFYKNGQIIKKVKSRH